MNHIEVAVLNKEVLAETKRLMGFAARITQHGNHIRCMKDALSVYEKPVSDKMVSNLVSLPHPTLQKFTTINVIVVGASRRFLAQITRHQNEVKFMSGSLQYNNWSDSADFVVPYELLNDFYGTNDYINSCKSAMSVYKTLSTNVDHDTAGYAAPQGLRNILLISATPYQWKHMISQRICRRNTVETRYVMLKIWEELYEMDPVLFSVETTGSFCQSGGCKEGKMTCGKSMHKMTPHEILCADFPLLCKE